MKTIRAKVVVSCDVIVDENVLHNIQKETTLLNDNDAANQILFAFLNPKIDIYNDEEAVCGQWDNVCEFKDRLKNFEVEQSE